MALLGNTALLARFLGPWDIGKAGDRDRERDLDLGRDCDRDFCRDCDWDLGRTRLGGILFIVNRVLFRPTHSA